MKDAPMTKWTFSALLGLGLVACGDATLSSAPPLVFPPEAYAEVTSDHGAFALELRTSPAQPVQGELAAELHLHDTNGAVVHGASVVVVPWMPAHGHGASVVPTVREEDAGVYLVERIECFMPGAWELRFHVSAAGVDDTATVSVDVH